MPSATIKLFLVHGDAKRLRTAELSNWTGKAVASGSHGSATVSEWKDAKERIKRANKLLQRKA